MTRTPILVTLTLAAAGWLAVLGCGGGGRESAAPTTAAGSDARPAVSPTAAPAAAPGAPIAGSTVAAGGQTGLAGAAADAKRAQMEIIRGQLRERLGAAYDAPVPTVDAAALDKGKEIYLLMCANCHGESGRGDGMMGAALNPRPADLTDAAEAAFYSDRGLLEIIRNGVPNSMMPPFGQQLSEEDLLAVFNYIRSLRGAQ